MIRKVDNMISASAAEAHRFGRVKRNGYDPAEVDAVVGRLVDTLATYERRMEALEARLEEADASADAIRRTFIAAEKTRDEILDSARGQADALREAASGEAEEIIHVARVQATELSERAASEAADLEQLAERLDTEIAAERQRLLEDAQRDADAIRMGAEDEAAQRVTNAAARLETEMTESVERAREAEHRAAMSAQAIATSTAWLRRDATLASEQLIADAQAQADVVVAEAEREAQATRAKIARLRSAVTSFEASARDLAVLATAQASIIDLSEIEALEASDVDLAAVTAMPIRPDQAAVSDDEPAVADDGEPVVDMAGAPLTEPPLLSVAEATADMEREDEDDDADATEVEPAKVTTYYQHSTGIPLSERVKIARKSG